jgi:hypothetical protein
MNPNCNKKEHKQKQKEEDIQRRKDAAQAFKIQL